MTVERRSAPTGYLLVLVDWDPGWTLYSIWLLKTSPAIITMQYTQLSLKQRPAQTVRFSQFDVAPKNDLEPNWLIQLLARIIE